VDFCELSLLRERVFFSPFFFVVLPSVSSVWPAPDPLARPELLDPDWLDEVLGAPALLVPDCAIAQGSEIAAASVVIRNFFMEASPQA
jgi:hypothetical protein